MKGRVLKSTGSWYTIQTEAKDIILCRIKGKFRLDNLNATNPISVGDNVILEREEGLDTAVITVIEDRRNYIIRQSPHKRLQRHIIASNLDLAMVIITFSSPRTSLGFVDRFLLTCEMYHIPACLVFNKQDIYTEKDKKKFEEAVEVYEHLGYPCFPVSAITGAGMEELGKVLDNKTCLVSGHSGVGKSTLLNYFNPSLDLRTNEISDFSGKGMHTTTFSEMIELRENTYIIDTPGIKEFGIVDAEPSEIGHYFVEIREFSKKCKFNNCLHRDEPKCAVKAGFEEGEIADFRYINYLNMLADTEAINYWER